MSDNASDEEQQQQMQEIWICADIWLAVFAFIDPFELWLKMALISDRFDSLVDMHFISKKWSLGSLQILPAFRGKGAEIVTSAGERLPIPQGPMPDRVIAFESIEIRYVDQTVIEFLQSIRRLFDSSNTAGVIATFDDQSRSWEIIRQQIWPLISGYAEEIADASSRQAVDKWLLTPREDDLPKMLYCDFYLGRMEGLKGSVVNASAPVNFIARLRELDYVHNVFEIDEEWERERLIFQRLNDDDKWLLAREEEEPMEWDWHYNRITIDFNDMDIGDDMVDAKAGPSAPKKLWTNEFDGGNSNRK
uniref:F-box domain-containing protein n=1 Tax=Globodera pallida TaxID=36090 RepID=A0A183BXD2_GLOPA